MQSGTTLGAKSREAARAGMPWWVGLEGKESEMLGEDDSKALGRLLTSLTAKTVGREGFGVASKGRVGVVEGRKSESLAPGTCLA